jgi:predicted ArsR family transcriptional regulator
VARSGTRSTGGRPQVLYVLTEAGQEQFARRYSWFADLLVGLLKDELGKDGLATKLHSIGAGVATALQRKSAPSAPLSERLGELSSAMGGLGYETESALQGRGREVVAHNCIFHQLAAAHPEICAFDLGFMEKFANAKVEHVECMARGQHVCRFRFQSK